MDERFNPAVYPDLIDLCLATGLRRHELELICPEDIRWQDGKRRLKSVGTWGTTELIC